MRGRESEGAIGAERREEGGVGRERNVGEGVAVDFAVAC